MNVPLWKHFLRESRWLLAGCAALVFGFMWLRVWIVGQIDTPHLQRLFTRLAPDFVKDLLPVPIEFVLSSSGRIALGYDEIAVILMLALWSIARGSDVVAGELGRGTLELVLAQPVSRMRYLTTHSAVTLLGVVLISTAAWLGTATGIATVRLQPPSEAALFLPACANLASLGIALAGVAMLLSAASSNRAYVVGMVVGFYVVMLTLKIVGLLVEDLRWLKSLSLVSAYEPQVLTMIHQMAAAGAWSDTFRYCGVLVAAGLGCWLVSAAIFARRDLPAPL